MNHGGIDDQFKKYEHRYKKSMDLKNFSLQQRKEFAQNATSRCSSRLDNLIESREKKDQDSLNLFIHHFGVKEKKLSKFQKAELKKQRERHAKKEQKWKAAADGIKDRREADHRDGAEAILKKQREASKALREYSLDRARNLAVRKEREHLRTQDTKKNQEIQKWQMDQQKMKILEKHMKISDNLNQKKQRKHHMQEYARIANQMRVDRVQESKSNIYY